jgi:hypothetical protein
MEKRERCYSFILSRMPHEITVNKLCPRFQDLPEGDYPMDWYHDEEADTSSTARPLVTPSAFTRIGSDYTETVVSAVDPMAATNERPRIMDDCKSSSSYPYPTKWGRYNMFSSCCDEDSAIIFTTGRLPDVNHP